MIHAVLTRSVYDPAQWDEASTRRRLRRFRAYAVASMAAQTVKPDVWVLAVHPDDRCRDERLDIAASAGVPLHVFDFAPTGDRAAIARAGYSHHWQLPATAKLTTRLDDDDVLAATFVARLRAALDPARGLCAYVFPHGFRVLGQRVEPYHHPRNMFASVFTPSGDQRNVYNWRHMKIRDELPVVDVDDRPAWVWVRHDDALTGGRRRPTDRIDDRFRAMFPRVDWEAT